MNKLFHSAIVRMTAWYMLILMTLSLFFSIIVYGLAAGQIQQALGPHRNFERQIFLEGEEVLQLRFKRINESRASLLINLVIFNFVILVLGGFCSYLLARKTVEPIEKALEAQRRFTSDAAHELKTPLTVMQSEIEVGLRDKAATKKSLQTTLGSNLEEVNRLRTLTDRLLLLANNKKLELAEVQLDEVMIEAVNRIVPAAQRKKIRIDSKIKPRQVLASHEALIDVLVILLDNAIKYSPAKSRIKLSSVVKNKQVMISISDEGEGILEQDREHIFERFYRADQSRSKLNVEGHGLGLSIAQQIIKQHGGSIGFTNNKTKGTTFTIKLLCA